MHFIEKSKQFCRQVLQAILAILEWFFRQSADQPVWLGLRNLRQSRHY